MIEFRVRHSRSWLDGHYSRMLAYQLADRLVARCRHEKVLKLELTYRREEYSDPADLYYRASEERHVRRFIESLKRHLNTNLTGRWLCKMEFQQGGWVHWHLLIVGFEFIDHGILTDLWGHGHVWVRPANERQLRYICKYIAKDGQFPPFLYLRPIRSVKIIRVSPGFWNQSNDSEFQDEPEEEKTHKEPHDPEPEPLKMPIYVTVGELIERGEEVIVCRNEERKYYAQVKGDPWGLFRALCRLGGKVCGSEKGWMQLAGVDMEDVRRLAAWQEAGVFGVAGEHRRTRAGAAAGAQPATPAIHLIHSGNPPKESLDIPPRVNIPIRKWMKAVVEWQLGWREQSENHGSTHECIEDYMLLAGEVQG